MRGSQATDVEIILAESSCGPDRDYGSTTRRAEQRFNLYAHDVISAVEFMTEAVLQMTTAKTRSVLVLFALLVHHEEHTRSVYT